MRSDAPGRRDGRCEIRTADRRSRSSVWWRLRARVCLAIALLSGCYSPPDFVFVPGEDFDQSLSIRSEQGLAATVRPDEGLVLHAVRTSGPWIEVRRDSLPVDACWWASPPEPVEEEVAGSVRWRSTPEEAAEFNLDLRTDGTREVRFSRPGVYDLTAESGAWCTSEPYSAPETIRVEVSGAG